MDAEHFNRLTRALTAVRSRRAFSRILRGFALGGSLALLDLAETEAKRKKGKKKRKHRNNRNKRKTCNELVILLCDPNACREQTCNERTGNWECALKVCPSPQLCGRVEGPEELRCFEPCNGGTCNRSTDTCVDNNRCCLVGVAGYSECRPPTPPLAYR